MARGELLSIVNFGVAEKLIFHSGGVEVMYHCNSEKYSFKEPVTPEVFQQAVAYIDQLKKLRSV